jgi:hypothetical protein
MLSGATQDLVQEGSRAGQAEPPLTEEKTMGWAGPYLVWRTEVAEACPFSP